MAYFVAPDAQGRGIASEAMRAFLAACFDAFDLPAIHADRFEDNPASGAVLERLGFRRTGLGVGESAARPGPARLVLYRLDAEAA